MSDQEQTINSDYKEIADCREINLYGFYLVNDENEVEWIDLSEI